MYVYTKDSIENTQWRIFKSDRGYTVSIWDLDAGQPFSVMYIYKTLEEATNYIESKGA